MTPMQRGGAFVLSLDRPASWRHPPSRVVSINVSRLHDGTSWHHLISWVGGLGWASWLWGGGAGEGGLW
jgi:hypothetical protein